MYHVKFFNVPPEKRGEVPKVMSPIGEIAEKTEGVETIGLFFLRGSGYMYATVTKYKDYATWEKFWQIISKERGKGIQIITEETDMFFEEVQIE